MKGEAMVTPLPTSTSTTAAVDEEMEKIQRSLRTEQDNRVLTSKDPDPNSVTFYVAKEE